jgi:2-polyprenyl-3-methyl-5-hydroxy-6-metoxy-1,4-benzoquinol methylase
VADPAPAAGAGGFDCAVCSRGSFEEACEKEGYRYVRCNGCGTVRQYPYPGERELLEFYANYQTHKSSASVYLTDAGYEAYSRDKLLTFADLGLSPAVFTGKRLCDVGCGIGQFLQFVQRFGPGPSFGLDLSEECVQSARARGLDVRGEDFLALRERFDVVSMWHVIDHLLQPRAFVEQAHRLLEPGGSRIIETPVVGPVSEAFGADWRFYMPVEHVNLFSPQGLVDLCRQAGFELKASVRFGSGNDSGTAQPRNKRAMDTLAKKLGFGDTMAAWFVKQEAG